MVEAGKRAQIQAELTEMSDQLWAGWDSYEVQLEEADKNYVAKSVTGEDGIATMLIKWRCDGLTEEQWEAWVTDPTIVSVACNQRLTRIELPDDEGKAVRLLKMNMPMLISNRSTLTTFYRYEKVDGTKVVVHSSRGNEQLVEANAGQIGSDVINNNIITYMGYKPYEGGMELAHIIKMDPQGMIPSYIKNKATTRLTTSLKIIVAYVKDGTVPEPIF